MYETIFSLKKRTFGEIEELTAIMKKIAENDESFDWRVDSRGYGKFLIINSKTKDLAFKRGMWLKNKVKILNSEGFNVKSK